MVRTAGLTAAAAAILVAYTLGGGKPPAVRPESAPPAPAAQPGQARLDTTSRLNAQLNAPATATAGEPLTVLAYRNPKLCGPAELRFDGAPVPHKAIRYPGLDDLFHPQIFLSMDVPNSARAGIHHIELRGPVRSTRGTICGDVPEHQATIATTAISVTPAAGS
jgi:hypothetical protein